jgi:uncharacterized membrane protein
VHCPRWRILRIVVSETVMHAAVAHACVYWATQPPSTGNTTPVMNDAASEQSQTTAAITSAASPSRPMSSAARHCSSSLGHEAKTRATIGV